MLNPLLSIRERYHPLFRLRKFTAFQRLTHYLDIPVAIPFPSVSHRIYVSLSKNLSWVLSLGAAGEERERQHFVALVKLAEFQTFLDIGANVGLYGFIFRTVVPAGSVTMIEPDGDNADLIRRTINLAGLGNINLVQAAASDLSGTLNFCRDDLSGATGSIDRGYKNAFVTVHHRYTPSTIEVRSVTVDELCAGSDPDFVKIDVEGAELSVLRGAEKTIARSRPALFLECDDRQASVHAFLSEQGYNLFDFSLMQATERVVHNCLALHSVKHSSIIAAIDMGNVLKT